MPSGGAEVLLATVYSVGSGGVRLTLDGQTYATRKWYKVLSSASYSPTAGDRVMVVKMSGTYVVIGAL